MKQMTNFTKHVSDTNNARSFKTILFLLIVLACSSSTVFAQGCLVPSLDISTGLNPASGGYITAGNHDPKWKVTCKSPDNDTVTAPGNAPAPYQAWVINPTSGWTNSSSSRWISFLSVNNYRTDTTGTYKDCFTRCFTACAPGDFTINLQIAGDDQISSITVDGTTIYTTSLPLPSTTNFDHYTSVRTGAITLSCGEHCITVNALNYPWPPSVVNYHGINIVGSVNSVGGTNALVSETKQCMTYVCQCCVDSCYWSVNGNTIHSGKNIFGTVSNDDIRIVTNNTDRAVVQAGGNMGIRQLSPSTTLDVDCVPTSAPSGLQFENLPFGHGNALVVDPSGYVYVSQNTAFRPAAGDISELQRQIDDLKKEIAELKAQKNITDVSADNTGSSLLATPNPSNGQINVSYTIGGAFNNAVIKVIDIQGKVITMQPVNSAKGIVSLNLPPSVAAGSIVITLIVDGKQIAQQKEVIVK